MNRKLGCLLSLLWALTAVATDDSRSGAQRCLSCHDFGASSPVHPLLASKHGDVHRPGTPMALRGCESCHGDSTAHRRAPTKHPPGLSFGPRWSASAAQQNQACLNCHQGNVAQHWAGGTHEQQQVTCVTCHDMHNTAKKLLHDQQARVCATCHKTQQQGIHALHQALAKQPDCTLCHNPHANAEAKPQLLSNRSEGCRFCHDLPAMAVDPKVSAKANSYHKTLTQLGRTCVDCHQGIAHAHADSVPPVLSPPDSSRQIVLFYPGQKDLDWLFGEHPGSQMVRQGMACQQCHRPKELNSTQLPGSAQLLRTVNVSLDHTADNVIVRLSWDGDRADADVALMWSAGPNKEFAHTGCWAACHNDMPGMNRNRGEPVGKYLSVSRAQLRRIGQPSLKKTEQALAELMAAGEFVSLWRVLLKGARGSELQTGKILDQVNWQVPASGRALTQFDNGRWLVQIFIPKAQFGRGRVVLGLAVHGVNGAGGGHWVSQPLVATADAGGVRFDEQP
jgi:DmsE family decaheme c-type cytochrome